MALAGIDNRKKKKDLGMKEKVYIYFVATAREKITKTNSKMLNCFISLAVSKTLKTFSLDLCRKLTGSGF